MVNWLSKESSIVFIVIIFTAVGAFVSLLSKQLTAHSKKKADEDKALLKKLLEGFGLEIPPELIEQDNPIIKSIKTH